MAKILGITQDSVSRLEQRAHLLLSTLRKTVEAMGGNLSLIAEFPDKKPIKLTGPSDGIVRPQKKTANREPKGTSRAHPQSR